MSDQEDYDDEQMDIDPSQSAKVIDLDAEGSDSENDSDDSDSDGGDEEEQLYKKYLELLGEIQTQSYVYDNYVQLVQVAQ